jgi:hypothetical protein
LWALKFIIRSSAGLRGETHAQLATKTQPRTNQPKAREMQHELAALGFEIDWNELK